jgi:hypothetical protein
MKKSITIYDLEDTLERLIRDRAKSLNQSLDKTIKSLLKDSLGTEPAARRADRRRKEFMDLFGAWTKSDLEEFFEAMDDLPDVQTTD